MFPENNLSVEFITDNWSQRLKDQTYTDITGDCNESTTGVFVSCLSILVSKSVYVLCLVECE